jgi:hypothetical protein
MTLSHIDVTDWTRFWFFLHCQVGSGFLKSLYGKEERVSQIEEYCCQITATGELIHSYMKSVLNLNRCRQISAVLDIKAWYEKNEQAQIADQLVLHKHLDVLEANQQQLMKELGMFKYHATSPPAHHSRLH